MLYGKIEYKNCKIILYDEETNRTIGEERIAKYEHATRTIMVEKKAFQETPHEKVSILIFYDNALHEYRGTVWKSRSEASSYTIGLYKGEEKEDRESVRYTVNTPATVEHYVIAGKLVPLRKTVEVLVINLSTTGCLISGNINHFNIGAAFLLKLPIAENIVELKTTVVRIHKVDKDTAEYGCKF